MEGAIASSHPISTKKSLHQIELINGNAKTGFNTQFYLLFLGFFLP
jgi:hypothetical protein